jgi:hypothetical protein
MLYGSPKLNAEVSALICLQAKLFSEKRLPSEERCETRKGYENARAFPAITIPGRTSRIKRKGGAARE